MNDQIKTPPSRPVINRSFAGIDTVVRHLQGLGFDMESLNSTWDDKTISRYIEAIIKIGLPINIVSIGGSPREESPEVFSNHNELYALYCFYTKGLKLTGCRDQTLDGKTLSDLNEMDRNLFRFASIPYYIFGFTTPETLELYRELI